ncbi:MAG: hypothetical protein C0413_01815 [Clostridiales bacterium]|nr:hypothetical protein [Clostridiales bacterium]
MSHNGARSGAPVDWSDPEQAAAQARIDALRNMISLNPMSYSEKEEIVRSRLADETKRAEETTRMKKEKPKKNWDI